MEITELMIGDIVQYLDGKKLITVVVVKVDGSGNVVRLKQKDCHKFNTTIDFLRPIPITPEILEKNGFESFSGMWYFQTKERKPIRIAFKKNNTITMSLNCIPIPTGIKYLHEFQNVLRVFKIDKQISLP